MSDFTHSQEKRLQQMILPGIQVDGDSKPNGSAFSDPAFAGNKTQPVHRWIPWIAGFSGDLVKEAIDKYLPEHGIVLDPFSGVGTTLVEAVLAGHDALGFEINPYAALASRAKANAYRYDANAIHYQLKRFDVFYQERIDTDYHPLSSPPEGFRTRSPFYSPDVLRKVLILQDFIQTIADESLRELFQLAFASTMVRYSNYSYEPSLGRRVSAGKSEILDYPVAEEVIDKLLAMEEDIRWVQQAVDYQNNPPEAEVYLASFFDYARHIEPETVDLIITSPPYLNNYHYNRNTRPQLYWLGYASKPKDLKPLEQANFGKYWQTVRDKERIDLDFDLPETDLEERLARLRTVRPDKGVYGGNGWANYAASYFNDCRKFACGINHVLKPGSTALVVIGNSILQGIAIPTDEYFGAIAVSVGLEMVDIHIPRETRVGNSIIQSDVRGEKAKDEHQLYEAVIEIKKRK